MTRLYVFRHGQTDWNVQQRFQGHVDNPLNETGRLQALELSHPLKEMNIQAIFSSDLLRAKHTAQIIAKTTQVKIIEHAGLREAHFGDAQGKTAKEIKTEYGEELTRQWRSADPDHLDVRYPGGETAREVMKRARTSLEELLKKHSYERVGVSTHGGTIRRLIQSIAPEEVTPVPIPNGVLYLVEFDPKRGWTFPQYLPLQKAN